MSGAKTAQLAWCGTADVERVTALHRAKPAPSPRSRTGRRMRGRYSALMSRTWKKLPETLFSIATLLFQIACTVTLPSW